MARAMCCLILATMILFPTSFARAGDRFLQPYPSSWLP